MRRVRGVPRLRNVCLHPANSRGNDVLGMCSGGVEKFIGAINNQIHTFDVHDGSTTHIIVGDKKGRHVGELKGNYNI